MSTPTGNDTGPGMNTPGTQTMPAWSRNTTHDH